MIGRLINNLTVKSRILAVLVVVIAVVTVAVAALRANHVREQTDTLLEERLKGNANMTFGIFDTVMVYTTWMLDLAASNARLGFTLPEYNMETQLANIFISMNNETDGLHTYENIAVFDADFNLAAIANPVGDLPDILMFPEYFDEQLAGTWVSPVFENAGGHLQFLFSKPVMDGDSFLGMVALTGNTELFTYFLRDFVQAYDSFVNIADRSGVIFFSNRPEAYIGRHVDDLGVTEAFGFIPMNTVFTHNSALTGIDKIAYVTHDEHLNWTIVSFFDAYAVENVNWIIFTSLLPAVSGIILAAGLVVLIIHISLKPLGALAAAAKKVAGGDIDVKFDLRRNDEIAQVSQSFLEILSALSILQDNFKKAETAMTHRDILYRLEDSRLGGIYNQMLSMTNTIIDEFQDFFELLSEPIIIIGKNYEVKYANSIISGGLTNYVGLHINDFLNEEVTHYFSSALTDGASHTETDIQVELVPGQLHDLELRCIPFMVDNEISGAMLSLTNITHIKEMQRSKYEAESASKAKSDFLSKMSHEIRTPMNAILGMSELILNEDITDTAREQAATIKQSGHHLLSIINDILDLSKVESGKLEIVNAGYLFHSTIHDVVSIIKMRMTDPKLRFTIYMQHDIPNELVGDEVRVRQILLNLLTNAVKYTKEGFFSLDITSEMIDSDNILLIMKIKDTGIGIKPENMELLFGEFAQFDTEKNRNVEGTGLGLAITRNFVKLMGGTIEVTSVYGEGSEFIIRLPQQLGGKNEASGYGAWPPDFRNERILLYGNTPIYMEYAAKTLKDLQTEVHIITDDSDLYNKLTENRWSHIFVEDDYAAAARHIVTTGDIETKVVIMSDSYDAKNGQNLPVLISPAYLISIVNVLSGRDSMYFSDSQQMELFAAPEAKILLVDDIETNLKVGQGLLKPYGMNVDVCLSGKEAVDAVKAFDYDLILMDHMMPEMDGIETVSIIRSLAANMSEKYAKIPIIALTANAIVGAKEMFLLSGFNDFLSKPIEMSKLNGILAKWIPMEKQKPSGSVQSPIDEKDEAEITIPDVNVARGIALSGGSTESYLDTLSSFRKDGLKKISELAACLETANLTLYTTYVHALKSACANIGAGKLSEEAEILEAAGIKKDLQFISNSNDNFIVGLKKLLADINEVIAVNTIKPDNVVSQDMDALKNVLETFKAAMETFDVETIDQTGEALRAFTQVSDIGESVNDILQNAFVGKYKQAAAQIDELLLRLK